MDYEDPGWTPILISMGSRIFMPWLWLMPSRNRRLREQVLGSVLLADRLAFSGVVGAVFAFLYVLTFMMTSPHRWGSPGPLGFAVAAIGLAAIAWVKRPGSRALDCTAPTTLLRTYQSRFYLGVGASELPALMGFGVTFIHARMWLYVLGLGFTSAVLFLVSPSRRNILKLQAGLDSDGCALSLGQVLSSSPPSIARVR